MKVVHTIEVPFGATVRRIEIVVGDLTRIPEEHRVDLLVVSAFPGDYTPSQTSLIGALQRTGLSVEKLSLDPDADLRQDFSCWISKKIEPPIEGLSFTRVLCFEPKVRDEPPEVVGDIFQAIAPFTYADPAVRSVAMPVVAAGDQGYSVSTMLPPLLDAARRWLAVGFPVHTVKLVLHTESALAEAQGVLSAAQRPRREDFSDFFVENYRQLEPPLPPKPYDVFVSYSRHDKAAAKHLTWHLKRLGLRVFIDETEIEVGAVWQQRIFDALEECAMLIALYSPDFVASKVCKEEFNIAWARSRELERNLIHPILLRDASLPTYMRMLSYLDCRISDRKKISAAASAFAKSLKSGNGGGRETRA